MRNTLYYGDNLAVLREHVATASVDLCYLDPPFNSNRSYNVLFKEESGASSDAQIKAFDDTWHWPGAVDTYHELVTHTGGKVGEMVGALHGVLGGNQMMAYLVMMAARLVEMHRVLKPTGSLYLHCDPTASHYLKVVLDCVFGTENYRSEVTWQRTNVHSDSKTWSAVADVILFYSRSAKFTWHAQYLPHSDDHIASKYGHKDADGRAFTLSDMTSPNPRPNMMYEWKGHAYPQNGWRYSKETMANLDADRRIWYPDDKSKRPRLKRYLDEMPGRLLSNIWTDIFPINSQAAERLGYPTQKPVALLERIISGSSNPGDVVLDPFCGCGTTVIAAQKMGRPWLGIDITHLSTSLLKSRLLDTYGLQPRKDYDVVGEPIDLGGAKALAEQDKFQFQFWALSLIAARPLGAVGDSKQGKKGSDKGIDGTISFIDDASDKPKRVIVQVKGGGVKSGDIRDLVGTLEREKGAIGVFITLEPATSHMTSEAASAGLYTSPGWNKTYPRIQIYTIADLLHGAQVKMPPSNITFKRSQREEVQGHQPGLGLDG